MTADTALDQPTGLLALPPELVTSIVDFIDPLSLVDFACSCKFVAQCCRDVLRRHQVACEYRVCTDVLPTALPELLRKLRVDPICAWHVRDLEFCYNRTNWARWKKFQFEVEESSNMRGRPPPPDYAFTQDERSVFLSLLRQHFYFSETDIDKAREDLEKGNDAPMKLLVFAMCPRIRSVKFSRHTASSGRDAFESQNQPDPFHGPRSSLDYIQRAINLHSQHSEQTWPVGFSSLSNINVGTETGTEIDELAVASSPHLFADLMHLPNLHSMYFHGMRQDIHEQIADDQDGTLAPYNIDEGSSSLQHIFLDDALGLSWKFRKAMVAGCEQLKWLTVTNSDMDDIDAIVQDAGDVHKDSMETLMFYKTDRLHGYRCNMFRPESLNGFNKLKTIYIDASDVMLDAFYNYDGKTSDGQNHEWIGDRKFFIDFFVNAAFPESMEVLVLGTMPHSRTHDGDIDFFDEAIETMIRTKQEPGYADEDDGDQNFEIRRFPNLKAICLGALDELHFDTHVNEPLRRPRQSRWFSRAIAAGRKAGVDVHTRTTRGQPFHKIEFPMPPSIAGLASAPELLEESLVFDVYTGRWGPQSCDNCGRCEDCLQQYDASVWKEVEDELVQTDL